jgi:hypothetical protein
MKEREEGGYDLWKLRRQLNLENDQFEIIKDKLLRDRSEASRRSPRCGDGGAEGEGEKERATAAEHWGFVMGLDEIGHFG